MLLARYGPEESHRTPDVWLGRGRRNQAAGVVVYFGLFDGSVRASVDAGVVGTVKAQENSRGKHEVQDGVQSIPERSKDRARKQKTRGQKDRAKRTDGADSSQDAEIMW